MGRKNLYDDEFDLKSGKRQAAYKTALDIRKFEIELYWKRSAYFLSFITLIAGAYGTAFYNLGTKSEFILLFLSSLGLVFSIAWFFANKGSKFWQENWENHVDLMEDDLSGPLYKTVLSRPEAISWRNYITAPAPYSVSKLNQTLSFYVCFIWAAFFTNHSVPIHTNLDFSLERSLVILGTVLVIWQLWKGGRTHDPNHKIKHSLRKTEFN